MSKNWTQNFNPKAKKSSKRPKNENIPSALLEQDEEPELVSHSSQRKHKHSSILASIRFIDTVDSIS